MAAPELLCGLVGGGATASGVAGGSALLGGLAKGAAVAAIVTGGVGGAELAVEKTLQTESGGRADVVEVASDPSPAPQAILKTPATPAPAAKRAAAPAVEMAVTKEPAPTAAEVTAEPPRKAPRRR